MERLSESFSKYASEPAISLDGESLSYEELRERAVAVSSALCDLPPGPVGILAGRGIPGAIAILGVVFSGRPYVPLNPKFPDARLREIARRAGCAGIVADEESANRLSDVFAASDLPPLVDDRGNDSAGLIIQAAPEDGSVSERTAADFVYIMFTSGSTGIPKGIGISAENLSAYLSHVTEAFAVEPGCRASQMFDFSFDLSVHDLFVTWLGGGELCLPGRADMLAPANYILRNRLTHWFSVPSVPSLMNKLGMLRAGAFPSLRQSLFCGEALPEETARQWSVSAPGSTLWNLYGPTEATIAFTAHRWSPDDDGDDSETVSIGKPFPGQRVRIVREKPTDPVGELWLGGSQVAGGYFSAEESQADAFLESPDEPGTSWYRTGDLVAERPDGTLHFRGRLDSQVQIQGHRVELGEVEAVLRKHAGGKPAVAVARRLGSDQTQEIVAFVEAAEADTDRILQGCAGQLPDYMVPKRIIVLPSFPLNSNGKIDRKALLVSLNE